MARAAFVASVDPDPLTVQFRSSAAPVPVQKVAAFLPRLQVGDEVRVDEEGGQLEIIDRVGAVGSQVEPSVVVGGESVTTSSPGDIGDPGESEDYSRSDHRHQRETYGSVTAMTAVDEPASDGGSSSISRADHRHGFPGFTGAATWDPGEVAQGDTTSTTVTVTGAAVGDVAVASHDEATTAGVLLFAHVTAADTVTVTLLNLTGSPLDLDEGTVRVVVLHFSP